jgi:glycosyltransferase involved in cell wall biosynthesis
MRAELEATAPGTVSFLGRVPYDEMPQVYRSGDALILPSRAEGLPRTVLEAFASGVPVVSSHLEHTAPVVQRAGETVPVGDVEGYRTALARVLDDPALGSTGRQVVLADFRWERTVKRTTRALQELL